MLRYILLTSIIARANGRHFFARQKISKFILRL